MYQSAYTTTPPDPYRSSPIAVSARQPYSGAFSPPPSAPIGNGFAPARSGQSNYNQYPSAQQNTRTPPNRYVPSSYAQQHQQLAPARHKGTLAPGKIVRVGESSVRIERYLSEGGYAHVYLTSSEKPIYPAKQGDQQGSKGYTEHCLKRIAFQDEAVWTDVEKEIAVMASHTRFYILFKMGLITGSSESSASERSSHAIPRIRAQPSAERRLRGFHPDGILRRSVVAFGCGD